MVPLITVSYRLYLYNLYQDVSGRSVVGFQIIPRVFLLLCKRRGTFIILGTSAITFIEQAAMRLFITRSAAHNSLEI